jgi:transcription-repair coupling factor (superfamily II helicase)
MVDALSVGSTALAVPEAATAFLLAGVARLSERRPMLVVTPTVRDAERMAHDLATFLGPGCVELFPAWDTLPFERVSPEVATMGQRLRLLWHLGVTEAATPVAPDAPAVVVAPVRALLQRLGPVDVAASPVRVERGARVDLDDLVGRLVSLGYRREYQVEHRGEVSVRGGIVDVFPSTSDLPVRIDLWGDEVDRLTEFDPGDQRSVSDLEAVELFGCREVLPTDGVRARARQLVGQAPWGRSQWERLAEGQLFDGMESWLPWLCDDDRVLPDLLGDGARVVLVDPRRMRDRAAELIDEEVALADALAVTWGVVEPDADGSDEHGVFPRLHVAYERLLEKCPAPVMSVVSVASSSATPAVVAMGWEPVHGDRARLAARLGALAEEGYSVTVCAEGAGSAERLAAVLGEEGLSVPVLADGADGAGDDLAGPGIRVVVAPLERGFVVPSAKVAVLAEADVTGRRRAHRPARARARAVDGFFDDLAPGDYVVHRQHGVARFKGMVTRTVNGAARDYLLLEYRGDDKLYLPSDQIEALTPYSGGEAPSLNRLGGSEWSKTRAKARAAVHEVAVELVELYRKRLQVRGHAFAPDTPWQQELEDAFGYAATPDQARAIDEVTADMEAERPMDRLVCGDVGFGKTEVAVRAAFKAVQDGKQVAVLVPTTLLAAQHAQTFADRYAGFPVRVEMLSRFLTSAESRKVVAGLEAGTVDVVVGTHRLLADDIRFKNLGLLVVDEEQRFGVSHKETIKAMTEGVDVLTLTASPIPRTLEMALTGIRDLSLINTPPAARQPILTYVGEYEEAAVVEAIRRELLREGQVFFVHNWVQNIESVAKRIRELVPEARVIIAHGQMDEGTLEQAVLDFWEKRYDVLVCTTIIESGIDMPTVNTLVVDRADRLGLGQLHQLRGRVGRSGHRAYAYLLHPADKVLSEAAYERLRTIGEQTELGSGFKIAMRDLEIRGAGNLLGRDQSGHIAAVGYDLYVQMVAEAVADMKGEPVRPAVEVKIDVPSDAHLPAAYVEREDLRLEAYRRLASVTGENEVNDIRAEWMDRFGPLPTPAEGLLAVGRLRVQCLRTGVREVSATAPRPGQVSSTAGRRRLVARLAPLTLPASARVRLRRLRPDAVYKEETGQLMVLLAPGEAPVEALTALLEELVPPDPAAAAAEKVPAAAGSARAAARDSSRTTARR